MRTAGQHGRRGEERDQRASRLGLPGPRRESGGENRGSLNFIRQWAHVVDALDGQQLADLLEADLGLAARHDGADALAHDAAPFVLHLRRDAEARKELGRQVGAAGARRVGDRPGAQQRAHERVHGADVRSWRSGAHRHADARPHEIGASARREPALVGERGERLGREDDEVGGLAACQPDGNGVGRTASGRAEHGDHPVAGHALELGDDLEQRRGEAAGGHHHNLRRSQVRAEQQETRQPEDDAMARERGAHGASKARPA